MSGAALSSKLTKINPSHTSHRTGARPKLDLSRLKNSSSCWTKVKSPSRLYRQAWYLQVNCRQVPEVSSWGKSFHTNLFPRWRQTLWYALTVPSLVLVMITDVPLPADGSSLVK